jgi:hypothetical protein
MIKSRDMRYNQIKKKTLILKSIPSLIFLFCFAVTQAQTLKLDREYKNTKHVLGKRISAQYSFENFKPNQFFCRF